jgi:choice-of-anchor A domain-containing protein
MLSVLTKRLAFSFGARSKSAKAHSDTARQQPRQHPALEELEDRIAFSLATTLQADFSILKDFGVLGLSGCKIDMTNPSTKVGGDVGIGPGGKQNFSDGFIDGKLVLDPTADNSKSNNVKHTYATVIKNLQPAVNAAVDASNAIANAPATKTIASINGSQTIFSTTHINVVKTGSISLDGSSILTLNAASNDYFLVNVTGKFSMTGSSKIKLSGGIDTTHVIFNVLGTGEQVAFTGSSVAVGTFLAINRDISVSGATVNGVLIGAMNHKIALTSGAQIQVNTPHFNPWDL